MNPKYIGCIARTNGEIVNIYFRDDAFNLLPIFSTVSEYKDTPFLISSDTINDMDDIELSLKTFLNKLTEKYEVDVITLNYTTDDLMTMIALDRL